MILWMSVQCHEFDDFFFKDLQFFRNCFFLEFYLEASMHMSVLLGWERKTDSNCSPEAIANISIKTHI